MNGPAANKRRAAESERPFVLLTDDDIKWFAKSSTNMVIASSASFRRGRDVEPGTLEHAAPGGAHERVTAGKDDPARQISRLPAGSRYFHLPQGGQGRPSRHCSGHAQRGLRGLPWQSLARGSPSLGLDKPPTTVQLRSSATSVK